MSEASPTESEGARCGECQTPQIDGARFCFDCGAALVPPPTCPQCSVDVPAEAKFCPGCGAKLIGPRPAEDVPEDDDEPEAVEPLVAARAVIEKAASELPPPKAGSSGMMGNVMLFIAILALLLVGIYVMNKDTQKEHNPFDGPAPMAGGAPTAPPAAPPSAVPKGEPIRGTVDVAPELKDAAQGTLYMVVRQAGSANRGPPLAVFRADSPTFPAAFEVGPAQVMMPNMPFNGPFDVYARLDRDGNAMTKEAGDLHSAAPLTQVAAGSADLKIVLDKRL